MNANSKFAISFDTFNNFCNREMELPISKYAESRGYVWTHTGGGCTAFTKSISDDKTIYITFHDGMNIPEDFDYPVDVGVYDESGGPEPLTFDTLELGLNYADTIDDSFVTDTTDTVTGKE